MNGLAKAACVIVAVASLSAIGAASLIAIDDTPTRNPQDIVATIAPTDPVRARLKTCEDQLRVRTAFAEDLAEIAARPYRNPGYNCYDHAKDLQKRLAINDIESTIFINEGRDHAWLAVWIEATTGEFMTTKHPFVVLEARDRNLNVICTK